MILHFLGFLPYLIISVAAGFLLLFFHPRWKIDMVNLVFFVAGSLLAGVMAGIFLNYSFPAAKNSVDFPFAVKSLILFFVAVSVFAGGYAGVSAWQGIIHRKMKSGK